MRTSSLALIAAPLFLAPVTARPLAQGGGELDPERLEPLITAIGAEIEHTYIFADVGAKVAAHLKQRLWDGAYEGLGLEALAGRVNVDLKAINGDKHLNAFPLPQGDAKKPAPPPEERAREEAERGRQTNHGFRKLEILDGNVGYLELTGFASPREAGETAVAAIGFFANVDALIIDLRGNGGGEASMIQLLCSYFFAEPTHINSFEHRGRAQIDQNWTLPHVPGKKLVDVPLYVLTSGRTFSAAEEFTYDLKCLKRATIVGERTGGGAHPGAVHEIEGMLAVFIPDGRAINPVTGTNWEGVGVEPDLAVPAAEALDAALREARRAAAARRAR